MKRKAKIIFITILFMTIIAAAVTTTLVLNGTFNLKANNSFDGDVVFVSAKTEKEGNAVISADGKAITYTSKNLSKLYEKTILDFEIANRNQYYDATVSIQCHTTTNEYADYVNIESNKTEYWLSAGSSQSDKITTTLVKPYDKEEPVNIAFTCNIVANPREREDIGPTYKAPTLYDLMEREASPDDRIDFSKIASISNGVGIFTVASTVNDQYPIHYYRGNVTNNNVLFANFCWKIVRTTETGGVKLI